MIEKREGPTPRGGAYSLAWYTDDAGNETTKAEATRALVSEYTEDGRWLFESVLVLEPKAGS